MNALQRGILLMLKSAVTGEGCLLPEGFSLEEALPIIKKHHMVTLAYQGAVNCGLDEMSPVMMQLMRSYCTQMLRSEGQMAAVQSLYEVFEKAYTLSEGNANPNALYAFLSKSLKSEEFAISKPAIRLMTE